MEFELIDKENEKLIEKLTKYRGKIYFGVPEETALKRKKGETINNAQLLAIHEHGSPVKNLPKRELLRPTIIRHEGEIREAFDKIYGYLLDGNNDLADSEMERLAQRVEMWLKKFFVEDNGWTPDKPSTIKAKNRKHGLPQDAKATTLIDTGKLRSSLRAVFIKK